MPPLRRARRRGTTVESGAILQIVDATGEIPNNLRNIDKMAKDQ